MESIFQQNDGDSCFKTLKIHNKMNCFAIKIAFLLYLGWMGALQDAKNAFCNCKKVGRSGLIPQQDGLGLGQRLHMIGRRAAGAGLFPGEMNARNAGVFCRAHIGEGIVPQHGSFGGGDAGLFHGHKEHAGVGLGGADLLADDAAPQCRGRSRNGRSGRAEWR